MNNALDIIKRRIGEGERVGVALSGGADSVCLFYLLLEALGKERLIAVNIEHGIRGESSISDSRFVSELCKAQGVRLIQKSVSVPRLCSQSGRSEETEARLVRRAVFEELISSGEVDYIATAHHLGDKTESVLMHLFRGCGISGLIGQTELDGRYLHPLINTPKERILRYLEERGIAFVTDESNFDTAYTRNFVRHEVIPRINERYDIQSAVLTVSESAKEDEQFIRSCMSGDYLTFRENEVRIDLAVFSLPKALIARYISDGARMLGRTTDFERKHISAVMALASGENGKKIDLGYELHAVKEYDRVTLYLGDERSLPVEDEPFAVGLTPFGAGYIEVYPTDGVKAGELTADLNLIPENAVIRARREGDIFKPFGGGTKKLKEFFIDKKIPVRRRDLIPLLCCDSEVLAVFGVEISDKIKVTEKTNTAVTLKYTED